MAKLNTIFAGNCLFCCTLKNQTLLEYIVFVKKQSEQTKKN